MHHLTWRVRTLNTNRKHVQRATAPRVHLVNGLNVNHSVLEKTHLYVLCDCPKVKDISKTLSYSFIESRHGIFAFTDKTILETLRNHLGIEYHVIGVTKDELQLYVDNVHVPAAVIYNSYSDIHERTSYFLYYLINCRHL
jgi:hypothetical protein